MASNFANNLVVVSPDTGGVERARAFAKRLDATLAIIDKRREGPNESQVMNIIGNVKGKRVIILDDMIDTAGTMVQAAAALESEGATEVVACCTHAVLSGPAIDRIDRLEPQGDHRDGHHPAARPGEGLQKENHRPARLGISQRGGSSYLLQRLGQLAVYLGAI